jgi:peptidyl-dipeptidase Dcp
MLLESRRSIRETSFASIPLPIHAPVQEAGQIMSTSTSANPDTNPLLSDFGNPFGLPPFQAIAPRHFTEAFPAAFAEHRQEVAAIADASEPADFENTIAALERAGATLERVAAMFWNLVSADTNDALQAIERDIAPKMAAHFAAIHSNGKLFARIKAVKETSEVNGLTPEDQRLIEKTYKRFVRAGAALSAEDKARHSQIIQRLASLGTQFSQNVLADETGYILPLETEADLAGLPDFVRDAAEAAARERDLSAPYAVTLSRSLIEPFLTYSVRRDLREKAYEAWVARGNNGGKSDNNAIIAEILDLRAERARLLGYETFADYKLDNTMAKTADRAEKLLRDVWEPAVMRANEEEAALEAAAKTEGANITIAAWDWWHYTDKVRQAKFDLKESELKPYLPLDQMLAAAFYTAGRLFGITFTERKDVDLYHPDARAWEVSAADGSHIGLFIGDYFARSSKRSGAWMSSYRVQRNLDAPVRPIIVNVCNFAKGREGEPTLLSMDDVRTLFHEMGHALHGLLSDVTYPSLAGTSVEGDFVELPSQLYEHWALEDDVLQQFARHYRTGAPMPKALVDKVHAAHTFNQGFATVEYLASALVDLAYHRCEDPSDVDPVEFEAEVLAKLNMPHAIGMRHRSSHFLHIFSGEGYAAGYYSYLWSEVLDADAFEAFKKTGDTFNPELAARLKESIYAAGGRRPGEEAYIAFRGRLPEIDGLLRDRGLVTG